MPDPGRRIRMLDRHARRVASTIQSEAYFHEARVLMLIAAFSADSHGVPGLDVLARLDFLLRFPTVLDRLSPPGPVWPEALEANPAERQAITVAFAPVHYGLWTDRYLLITGTLVGLRLIGIPHDRHAPSFVVSESGRSTAQNLAESPAWHRTAARADFLHEHLPTVAGQLDSLIRPALVDLNEHDMAQVSTRRHEPFNDDERHFGEDDGL